MKASEGDGAKEQLQFIPDVDSAESDPVDSTAEPGSAQLSVLSAIAAARDQDAARGD